jgi:hypothetical protein
MYNPYTFETYYAFTGSDGGVFQKVLDGGYNWEITLEKRGYLTYETTRYIEAFQTTSFILYMQDDSENDTTYITARGCQDMMKGIWLCNYSNVKCSQDSDCLTDFCSATNRCSAFNYSWCDVNDRPRNQRCIFSASFTGLMGNATDWVLDNFLWILIIVVILGVFTLFAIMLRSRK